MRTERTRSGAVLASSPLALVIAREIELLATRRGRLVAFDVEEIEAVGGDGEQAVGVRRQVDADDLGALVDHVVDESWVLMGEVAVVLTPREESR